MGNHLVDQATSYISKVISTLLGVISNYNYSYPIFNPQLLCPMILQVGGITEKIWVLGCWLGWILSRVPLTLTLDGVYGGLIRIFSRFLSSTLLSLLV